MRVWCLYAKTRFDASGPRVVDTQMPRVRVRRFRPPVIPTRTPLLPQLAERVDDAARELGELVQKQHAAL
jgi:hypothetical protein